MTPIDELRSYLHWGKRAIFTHPLMDLIQSNELVRVWKSDVDLKAVRRYCLFVGHGRSGHTLIGSLLDAHPNIIIAHELDALQLVEWGISKRWLFYCLLARSRWFKSKGAEWTGYSYEVPSQHKGEFASLQIIGDKKGGVSTARLCENPNLLKRLHRIVGIPVDVIHVKRHPLDNISTQARKDGIGIDAAIDRYFRQCATVKAVKEHFCNEEWLDWIDIIHEEFVDETEHSLRRICDFLGVDVDEEYLNDCEEIVFDSPNRSRRSVEYQKRHLSRIRQNISSFSSLEEYSVESKK